MTSLKLSASALALLVLAGCQTPVAMRPNLPALPADLAAACPDPGVREGRTVIGEFARNRQALAECRRRHGRTVALYDELRTRLGGGKR